MSFPFTEARKLIETEFKTEWAERCPVRYQNVRFNKPDNKTIWASLSMTFGRPLTRGIGTPRCVTRYPCVLTLQVYAPLGDGTRAANDLGEAFSDIFQWQQLTGVTERLDISFEQCYTGNEEEADAYYIVNYRVNFDLDQF